MSIIINPAIYGEMHRLVAQLAISLRPNCNRNRRLSMLAKSKLLIHRLSYIWLYFRRVKSSFLRHRNQVTGPDELLVTAVLANDAHNVEVFLNRGGNACSHTPRGGPIVVVAASRGQLDIVQMLVGAGADVNAFTPPHGVTALIGAASHGKVQTAEYLLRTGAAITSTLTTGHDAFLVAVDRGHIDVVVMLINNHAQGDLSSVRGEVALRIAQKHGFGDIAKVLVAAGARDRGGLLIPAGNPIDDGAICGSD